MREGGRGEDYEWWIERGGLGGILSIRRNVSTFSL